MVRLSAEGGRGNSLNLLESPREMETIAKARSLRNLINRGIRKMQHDTGFLNPFALDHDVWRQSVLGFE